MATTTVLLAGLPPLLEDMLSALLLGRFNVQTTRGSDGAANVIDIAAAAGAPVVIVASRNPSDLSSIDPYLAKAAAVSVIALSPNGTSACLHASKPAGSAMADVSAEEIVTAISAAAARRGVDNPLLGTRQISKVKET